VFVSELIAGELTAFVARLADESRAKMHAAAGERPKLLASQVIQH